MDRQTNAPSPEPSAPPATRVLDTETMDLLKSWALEDATDDPEQLEAARKELDEFKKAMNDSRAASGEAVIYP